MDNNSDTDREHAQTLIDMALSCRAHSSRKNKAGPPSKNAVTALLIVDVQNDFLPGGTLAVKRGDEIITHINNLREKATFDYVFLTKDWHPPNHISFAANHPGHKEYEVVQIEGGSQTLWPVHCVQGTRGSDFDSRLVTKDTDIVVHKGTDPRFDSYSGFWDNAKKNKTELDDKLKERGVTNITLCGLATDYCVGLTALHARELGYKVLLVIDGCKGINDQDSGKMTMKMMKAGVKLTNARKIITNWAL